MWRHQAYSRFQPNEVNSVVVNVDTPVLKLDDISKQWL